MDKDRSGIDATILTSLGGVGGPAVVAYLQALYRDFDKSKDKHKGGISITVSALIGAGDSGICDFLCRELQGTDHYRRQGCLNGLGLGAVRFGPSIRSSAAYSRLVDNVAQVAGHDADVEVRQSAVRALGNLAHPSAVQAGVSLLKDAEAKMRVAAANSLGSIAELHLPAYIVGAAPLNSRKQGSLFDVIGWIGPHGAIEALIACLDAPGDLRQAAGRALGWLGDLALVDSGILAIGKRRVISRARLLPLRALSGSP